MCSSVVDNNVMVSVFASSVVDNDVMVSVFASSVGDNDVMVSVFECGRKQCNGKCVRVW